MPNDKKSNDYSATMVPDPERIIEHGNQPAKFVPPPSPPKAVKNSGIGNLKKK